MNKNTIYSTPRKEIDIEEILIDAIELRRILGYRQKDVAEEMYCTQQAVHAFEAGKQGSSFLWAWYYEHGLREYRQIKYNFPVDRKEDGGIE